MNNSVIDIYVSSLSFQSTGVNECPSIRKDGVCLLDQKDLEFHRKYKKKLRNYIPANVYGHYKWLNSILRNELNFAPRGFKKLRFNHFSIESNNFDAFCLNGDFYTTITLIFGHEIEHWYYSVPGIDSNNLIRMCGSKILKKSHGIFDEPDILELRQKNLRPEPNYFLLDVVREAYSFEPTVTAISKPPYFTSRQRTNSDILEEEFGDNLAKFDRMLFTKEQLARFDIFDFSEDIAAIEEGCDALTVEDYAFS